MDLLSRISNFLAPKATAAGSAGKNTLGMLKDYIEYNTAKNAQDKQKQLIEYNQKRNIANEALKQFGFDANKQGNQFDPVQYGRGTLAGAGELASLYSPMGGGTKARMIVNAVPGITDAMGRGENIPNTILSGALSSIGGVGGEKIISGGSKIFNKLGKNLTGKADAIATDILGLTPLDKNKLEKVLGVKVKDYLRNNNLIGSDVSGIQKAIDPLQESFDSIANNPNLKIKGNDILEQAVSRIKELKDSPFEELKSRGSDIEKYFSNLFESKPLDNFGADFLTSQRKTADSLVKDFGQEGAVRSKNNQIREILQETIRKSADNQGVTGTGGKSLKDIGGKLNELYSILELAQKRQGKSGKLYDLIGAGIGGGIGNTLAPGIGSIVGLPIGAAAVEVLRSPTGVKALSNIAETSGNIMQKASENEAVNSALKKVLQQLGIKTGNGISNLIASSSDNKQGADNYNTNDNSENNSDQNSQITPNTQSIAQNTASQEQFDPNMEVTLLDGTKTTYGALQQQGAFQQAEQPQTNMQGLSDDQINQLSLLALISGDTKALQQIQAYQGIKDKINKGTEDKPLSAEQQKLALNAQSALDSLNIVREVSTNGVPATVGLPDYLGGNQAYQAAINNVADTIGRLRSGGAINKDEEIRFMNLLPKFGDNPQTVQFKLNQVEQLLQRFAYKQQPEVFQQQTNEAQPFMQYLGM